MKKVIKFFIKKLLNASEEETVADAINRKKYQILKKFNKKYFSINELERAFLDLNLRKGDTVIVHSAWRSFIGFNGTPQDVIDCIKRIVGEDGNIIMPAFTDNREVFRYYDKSSAGVISEVFRNNSGVQRSLNNIFSMCSYGNKSSYYTSEHIRSVYCFDSKSPYFKAIQDNAKIILLGLGKNPHKITAFHCASYNLRKKVKCYKDVYSFQKNVIMYDYNNNRIEKSIIDRNPNYKNDKRKFKLLFKKYIKKSEYKKINHLDIYIFDSKKMYDNVYNYILNNNFNIYK